MSRHRALLGLPAQHSDCKTGVERDDDEDHKQEPQESQMKTSYVLIPWYDELTLVVVVALRTASRMTMKKPISNLT